MNFDYTRLLIFVLLHFVFSNGATAQSYHQGTLMGYFYQIYPELPRSSENNFTTLPEESQADVYLIGQNILAGNLQEAGEAAQLINYELFLLRDTLTLYNYIILQPSLPITNHWGYYFFSENPCRSNVIIQSPHPIRDSNTGHQGIYCFEYLQARVFMLAGTHRCNSVRRNNCAGITSVCTGRPTKYPISDLSHETETMWHILTETFLSSITDPRFIQLHGFTKKGSDPYVIISNGSTHNPLGQKDYAAELAENLLEIDPVLSSKVAHKDNWTRLIGTTNVQGRLINGSPEPCQTSAVQNNGRFFHIEQEKARLRADPLGWNKMALALGRTFDDIVIDQWNAWDRNISNKSSIRLNLEDGPPFALQLKTDSLQILSNIQFSHPIVIQKADGCF